MLRSYKIGSRRFDTFAVTDFFCLARSCRVVEKFDKNHWFFLDFLQIGTREAIDQIGFLRNATRCRKTEETGFVQCVELYVCEFIASESIGALSCACWSVVICWKPAQFDSRELIGSGFSATRYDLGKRRQTHLANALSFMLARL